MAEWHPILVLYCINKKKEFDFDVRTISVGKYSYKLSSSSRVSKNLLIWLLSKTVQYNFWDCVEDREIILKKKPLILYIYIIGIYV